MSPNAARSDWGRAAFVVLGWQATLTVLGVVVERVFAPLQAAAPDPLHLPWSLLSHTYRWDSDWIHGVAQGSYATDPQTAVFYPLFPLLVNVVSLGTGQFLVAGLVVNTVATWLAVVALVRITCSYDADPRLVVGLLLTAPTAFYLHAFYSEAVFLALSCWAFRFARQRRWALVGLVLALAATSRAAAVLVVGLCLLELWRTRSWRQIPWLALPLAGFGAYACALWIVNGDPLAMFSGYGPGRRWDFNVVTPNVPATLVREARVVVEEPFTNFVLANQLLPLLGLALLLACSGYLVVALRRDGVPLAAFGVASFLMFTLNGNLVAVHRYLLPCITIYLALGVLAARVPRVRPVVQALAYVNVLTQAVLFVLFTSNQWAG